MHSHTLTRVIALCDPKVVSNYHRYNIKYSLDT